MSYPIPVMRLAAEVPKLFYKHAETWQDLYQRHEHPSESTRRLTYLAADRICKEFVKHVLEKQDIKSYDEPEGRMTRFICVAMTNFELTELLYRAYSEGQSDGLKRSISYVHQPEGQPR